MGFAGKDSFIDIFSKHVPSMNFSSVNNIKKIATTMGWNGEKDEKSRKFLSDLKDLSTEYNDMPFKTMVATINTFKQHTEYEVLYLHVREIPELKRLVDYYRAKTLLVKSNRISPIKSNWADANVNNYEYDYIVYNNGTLEDLEKQALEFIEWLKECDEDK